MGKKGNISLPSSRSIENDPPVDFLVKNMVECDSELLRDQLLSDLQYCSLCDMETTVPSLLKKDLMTSWIRFYQSHGRLFDLVVWLIRKELAEGNTFPQVSSPLLCHLTKMLLHVGEGEDSLLPSPQEMKGKNRERIKEKLFDPIILPAIEKEKEQGETFSTPQDLLRFLFEKKTKEDPKGFWETNNFPPLLKFLVKFTKKERDRSLSFLSFADHDPQISSPKFLSHRSRSPLQNTSPPFHSVSPTAPSSSPPPDQLYPDCVYSLVIIHFLCAIIKENKPKVTPTTSTPIKSDLHSTSSPSPRSHRFSRSLSLQAMIDDEPNQDKSSSRRLLMMLARGLKEVGAEYVKSGQPDGPIPGSSENDILLRFGHALRCLWDDLCEDVEATEVEKKAHRAGSEESQRDALMTLKTNLALCQSCLDDDLPGSSDLYARHFTDALRYMALSEEGWELLKVKKKQKDGVGHDLSVWMKLPEGSPFHLFKASKVFPVSVPTMFNFLRDVQNNFKTDKSLIAAEVVHTYTVSRKLVYIRNHFAWPMDDRDCLMSTHEMISPDFQEAVIAGHSVDLPSFPHAKGIDRVFLLISGYFIEAVQIDDSSERGSKGRRGSTGWKSQRKKNGCRVSYLIQCKTDSKLIPSSVLISIMKNTMRTKLDLEDHVSAGDISEFEAKNLPVRRRDAFSREKRGGSEIIENRKTSPKSGTSRFFDRASVKQLAKKTSPRGRKSSRRTSVGEGEQIQKKEPNPVASTPEYSLFKRPLNPDLNYDSTATAAVISAVSFTSSGDSENSLEEFSQQEGPFPVLSKVPSMIQQEEVPLDLPLEEILILMVSDVEVSDRYYKRKMFPKTFLGQDFVSCLLNHNVTRTIFEGEQIGNDMMQLGMLWPVQEGVQKLQNDDSLYRFACHALDLAGEKGGVEEDETLIPQLGQRIDATSKQCSQLSEDVRALKMEMSYVRHSLEKLEEATEKLASRPPPAPLAPLAPAPLPQPSPAPVVIQRQTEFSETHLILCCFLAVFSSLGSMILPQSILFLFQLVALGVIAAVFVWGRKKDDSPSSSLLLAQRSASQFSRPSMTNISSSASSPLSLPSSSSPMGGEEGVYEGEEKPIQPTVEGLRTIMSREFTGISQYQDDYIQSVLDVKGRSFDQTVQKFRKILSWRTSQDVDGIIKRRGEGVMRQLCEGCLYMYGYTDDGHPLFWVKPHLKDYKRLDVEKEIIVHILMLELGIKSLPTGINTFVLVAEAGKLGMRDFSPALMKGLINLLTSGYPDRLEGLYAGPINFVVRMIYKALSPVVPARLLSKVHLVDSMTSQLKEIVPAKYVEEPHPSFVVEEEGGGSHFSFRKMIEAQREEARLKGFKVPLLDELMEGGYCDGDGEEEEGEKGGKKEGEEKEGEEEEGEKEEEGVLKEEESKGKEKEGKKETKKEVKKEVKKEAKKEGKGKGKGKGSKKKEKEDKCGKGGVGEG